MVTLNVFNLKLSATYDEIKQLVFSKDFNSENDAEDFYYSNVGKHKDWKKFEIIGVKYGMGN